MTDTEEKNEIFEEKVDTTASVIAEEIAAEPKPEKKKKAKRVISEAEKERLKANLAKGRATSLANRKKKAQLRKIKKEEESKADDEKIFEALQKKLKPKQLEGENARLKEEIEKLRNQMNSMKESKAKPPPKQKLIQVLETPQLIERPVKDRREAMNPVEEVDEEVVEMAEPAPPPPPPAKKEMSKRDIMKMMRGL